MTTNLLKKYPENPWLWETLADSFFKMGDENLAKASIRKALAPVPEQMKQLRASLLRKQAEILVDSDAREAVNSLVQAYLLDRESELLAKALRDHADQYGKANLQQLPVPSSLSETEKLELSFVFREVGAPYARRLNSFKRRLRSLVDLCLESRIQPVLVTYPMVQSQVSEITRKVSDETGTSWLNLNDSFEIILKKENQKQQILRYGILTDEASDRIAEMIATDLVTRTTFGE